MFNPMALLQALGGMINIRNQINNFQQGLPQNMDPKQQALSDAQRMLNSGQMTQEQYNNVLQFADMINSGRINNFSQLAGILSGKNGGNNGV